MATRKLRAEAELDVAKAKKKAKEIFDGVESGGSTGGNAQAKKAADSAAKLAKNLDDAGEAAGKLNSGAMSLVRSFSGLAVGMAMSYAANMMPEGRKRDTVEYAAAGTIGAAGGAMMGKVGGGPGMIIGALAGLASGLGKTYLEKANEKNEAFAAWNKSEFDYASAKRFRDFINSMLDAKNGVSDFQDRIKKLNEELSRLKDVEPTLKKNVGLFIENGKYKLAGQQQEYLNDNRSRQDTITATIKTLETMSSKQHAFRESTTAADALSKVGGAFSAGDGGFRDLQRTNEQQLKVLEKIEAKTGAADKGGKF